MSDPGDSDRVRTTRFSSPPAAAPSSVEPDERTPLLLRIRSGPASATTAAAASSSDSEASPRANISPQEAEAQTQNQWANSKRGPKWSCRANPDNKMPVYTTIHRIRRDVTSVVEDYLSQEQLADVRINMTVLRPLVDKLYDLKDPSDGKKDTSIVYCLLVNRAQFLHEQSHLSNRQNVNYSRATLCELIATRILRRFSEDNSGPDGLLLLARILVGGFDPFYGAPSRYQIKAAESISKSYNKTLPALEIAILTESKHFLSSTPCQKVIDAIYEGRVIYTPSSFFDIIPDHYKLKPISLYDPRGAPILNQYRLIVPRTRNILEVMQYIILLVLYFVFMFSRDPSRFSVPEFMFVVYAIGWCVDQFASVLEHGWHVYTQNLWSFLDVGFVVLYAGYGILRIQGWLNGQIESRQQALDVMAMAAPLVVPRLAFNLQPNNMVILSLRSMMGSFTILTMLAAWCFAGFLLSMHWLSEGQHSLAEISKWMLWIWFGLDGTGIQRSAEFHWLLGPCLMVTFAFLGNTLFLTILVAMLSNTFAAIVRDATAEVAFRRAVLTLEGVKSDGIFAYQPPFNIVAAFIFLTLKMLKVSDRWLHKIHVAMVRFVNFPLLIIITYAERSLLWSTDGSTPHKWQPRARSKQWFLKKLTSTDHSDIRTVFKFDLPDGLEGEVAADDSLTQGLIRKQFTRHASSASMHGRRHDAASAKDVEQPRKHLRRDSTFPGVAHNLRGSVSDIEVVEGLSTRLSALETGVERIAGMLMKLTAERSDESRSDSHSETGKSDDGGYSGGSSIRPPTLPGQLHHLLQRGERIEDGDLGKGKGVDRDREMGESSTLRNTSEDTE